MIKSHMLMSMYIATLIVSPEKAAKFLFTWFDNNLMNSNAHKCHFLLSCNENTKVEIGSHETANTKSWK